MPRLAVLAWLIGAISGLILIVATYGQRKTNFEEVTLAKGTTAVYASVGGDRIHCADDRDMSLCIEGARKRNLSKTVVWLGNSQLHAINQYRSGEAGAVARLFERMQERDMDVLAFSQPNANLQEHAVVFSSLIGRLPISALLLPVVFDDTREDGIRESLRATLHSPGVEARLARFPAGVSILRINKPMPAGGETGAIRQTLQERLESRSNGWLEAHSDFWSARKEVRGDLILALYNLRNTIFRIRPDTARKVIPPRYAMNLSALQIILTLAQQEHIPVLVYVAPIRQDATLPYIPAEYTRFKADVADLAKRSGATFLNWEALVPIAFWGSKDATTVGGQVEIDYMHFQAAGHDLLANAAFDALKALN